MNPFFVDPNNHAPEVSQGDDWDDAAGFDPAVGATPTILPPRRTTGERVATGSPASQANNTSGLRIESKIARRSEDDDASRLQVQEINGGVVRLEQTEPPPPKVPRQVVFHERPPRSGKPRGVTHEWGSVKKHPLRWIVGGVVSVLVMIVVTFLLLPYINRPNAARSLPTDLSLQIVEEEQIEGIEQLDALLARQIDAENLFLTYASAQVVDDVRTLVHDAELAISHWRPLGVPATWTPSQPWIWQVMQAGSHGYCVLEGNLPDQSRFAAYFRLMDNRLLIDWKATTGYGTATFDQLSQGDGDASEIRGTIAPDFFHTSTWPESEYQSYQLLGPSGLSSIWCYAKRTDEAGIQLNSQFESGEILKHSTGGKRVTVRLTRGPDGSLPNQWLIEEMLHIDWITP